MFNGRTSLRVQAPENKKRQQTPGKSKPWLSLDTNFSRHIASPPQEIAYDDLSRRKAEEAEHSLPHYEAKRALPLQTQYTVGREQSTTKKSSALKPARLRLNDVAPGMIRSDVLDAEHVHGTLEEASRDRCASRDDVKTPVIIITPAREDFDLSGLVEPPLKHRRAPSSVYSRSTDYMLKSARLSRTPPIPPIPLLGLKAAGRLNLGALNVQNKKVDLRHTQAASVCTAFEEDTSPFTIPEPRSANGAHRSNGWWNFITSPFSAQSNAFMWRSPINEQTPILQDGLRRLSQDSDEGLHSAPAAYRDLEETGGSRKLPDRSMTAPSILSTSADNVDIYRIPSQGEAAKYYDLGRHFPSLIISPSQARSIFEDDTPVADIAGTTRHTSDTVTVLLKKESDETSVLAMPGAPVADPFGDEHVVSIGQSKTSFNALSAEEPRTPVPMPRMPEHSPTTIASQFSPLSPSPIVGKAHIAQVVGEVKGEQKEVDVPATRLRTPPAPQGLGATTMASRQEQHQDELFKRIQPTQARSISHSRTSSYGLGITGSEAELFPAAKEPDEKHMEDRDTKRPPWYRRFLWFFMALCTVLLTLTVVLLVMHIPQKRSDIPVQAQWVNLTGFPPLPVGVTTVAQPKSVRNDSGCISQASLWSCGTSAEQHSSLGLPDFRLEIRFRNDSSLNSSSVQSTRHKRSSATAFARSIAREARLLTRDTWSDSLFQAKPAPPTDQIFLGNTTDNNTAPYDGEATPFYISLVDATALISSSLHKRQSSVFPYPTADNSASTNTTSTGPQSIPGAILNNDGTPVPEQLYPLAEAQPLKLYKRQQHDEHYGFYTYYDKTVYIANRGNDTTISNSPLSNASAVCTWSQSRFLVQIWTRSSVASSIISRSNATSNGVIAANSTANDMNFPGSFPYAVTITVDRHGGDASQKGVYCHAIGANQHVEQNVKSWMTEDRSHGGTLINPASVPSSTSSTLSKRDGSAAGIDGGTGGCACAWQNWQ